MSRPLRLAAVALPLLGLAARWGMSDQTYRQGTEWDVPIAGYDPRDVLRGHYVEFAYEWPGLDGGRAAPLEALCLSGGAPVITAVEAIGDGAACDHPLRVASADVYGNNGLIRGRLYVGQDRGAELDAQLRRRDQRGIVTIRQREDGSFTPIAIRFRPLTPEERAERDPQIERAEDLRPPPAIMSE
jgi:hypothetical protein